MARAKRRADYERRAARRRWQAFDGGGGVAFGVPRFVIHKIGDGEYLDIDLCVRLSTVADLGVSLTLHLEDGSSFRCIRPDDISFSSLHAAFPPLLLCGTVTSSNQVCLHSLIYLYGLNDGTVYSWDLRCTLQVPPLYHSCW